MAKSITWPESDWACISLAEDKTYEDSMGISHSATDSNLELCAYQIRFQNTFMKKEEKGPV